MAEIVGISLWKIRVASVPSCGFRTELDDAEVALAGGVLLSARRREGRGGTGSGAWFVGPWTGSRFRPNRFPWPFPLFPFLFAFSFLIFFCNLAKTLQIDSNQF
jgi:hypothetical protein